MTTSLKALLSGGGAALDLQDMQLITSSTTWTALRSGKYRITAIGAGSSGSMVRSSNGSSGYAQGGTAGGLTQKTISLVAGNQLTIVVGLGGAARGTASPGSVVIGLGGGNTTVGGPGISLIAYGGNAPSAAPGSGALVEVTGGSATGGDINTTGGSSPARPDTSYHGGSSGAAVGVFTSVGYPGLVGQGNLTPGGSGIGGIGNTYSGGGSFGPAVTSSYGGPGRTLEQLTGNSDGASYSPVGSSFFALLNGQGGRYNYHGGAGGGGGGGGGGSSGATSGNGGWLAGGGMGATSTGNYYAGSGGFGGGGGAMFSYSASTCYSGKGGDGLVVIEFLGA